MKELQEIVDFCRGEVSVDFNSHRGRYQTTEEYLKELQELLDIDDFSSPEVKQEIISRDQIVELIAYPNTPVGSYRVIHYDLGGAVKEMKQILGIK